MTLQEIRTKILSWRVNSKAENNEHIDVLVALVDHLIAAESRKHNG